MDYKWSGLEQKWIGSRKLNFLPTPSEMVGFMFMGLAESGPTNISFKSYEHSSKRWALKCANRHFSKKGQILL